MQHDALYVSRAQRALFALRGESVVQTVLKTVDSLFFTGETDEDEDGMIFATKVAPEHARKSVSFAEQSLQAQRKRTETLVGSFDGPVIDIA